MKAEKNFNESEFISGIRKIFRANGDPVVAEGASNYMRKQFVYFGIPTPLRRQLIKEYLSSQPVPPHKALPALIRSLWKEPQREMQYFGMELYLKYKKAFSAADLEIFEFMITHKSWWDTIDFISPKLCAVLFRNDSSLIEPTVKKWLASGNTWLIRSAILFQLGYKKETDFDLLRRIIVRTAHEEEFFIRKAIGWALRQYSYTNASAVKKLVKEISLSPLSKKEALKAIERKRSQG